MELEQDEGGLINTADFFVTVIDIQDSAPYWTGTPYQARIDEENTPVCNLPLAQSKPVQYLVITDTLNTFFCPTLSTLDVVYANDPEANYN